MPTVTYSCATIGGGSYRVVGEGLPATTQGPGPEQIKVAAEKADAAAWCDWSSKTSCERRG